MSFFSLPCHLSCLVLPSVCHSFFSAHNIEDVCRSSASMECTLENLECMTFLPSLSVCCVSPARLAFQPLSLFDGRSLSLTVCFSLCLTFMSSFLFVFSVLTVSVVTCLLFSDTHRELSRILEFGVLVQTVTPLRDVRSFIHLFFSCFLHFVSLLAFCFSMPVFALCF